MPPVEQQGCWAQESLGNLNLQSPTTNTKWQAGRQYHAATLPLDQTREEFKDEILFTYFPSSCECNARLRQIANVLQVLLKVVILAVEPLGSYISCFLSL